MIPAWCIRRPVGTTLLALALLVAGGWAFTTLPVAPLPRVDMPVLMVQASLPGASPETMAASVATPLERHLGRIAGLDELTSTSTQGSTQWVLQFALDRDIEGAARDVQAATMAAAADLPAGMPSRPMVRKLNPSDAPILILAVTSEAHSLGALYELANSVLGPKIAQLEGVGQVSVAGGGQPAVRVQADPQKLAHAGYTLSDVATALAQTNAALPKGRLATERGREVLSANDQLFGAAAYRALLLPGSGPHVRLGDVADVQDDVENSRVAASFDGRPAVLVFVRRQANANIIATIARIEAALPGLQAALPENLELVVALNRAGTITAAVHDVEATLVLTVLLVVAVVWLFLGQLTATLVPAAAVPLSLVGTFGAMKLAGFSLNNLSLMALTISTGFVVDDAIVVTENIDRLRRLGMGRLQAALRGSREIAFTVVSMTASLWAVFLPLLLMGDVVGRMFYEFAWTLGIAVALSAGVSLTVTPMMCAYLLGRSHGAPRWAAAFDRLFERCTQAYGRTLSHALQRPYAVASATLWAVGLTVVLCAGLPKGLFPEQDTGMLMGFTEGPQDTSFAAMQKRQQAVAEVVLADADVAHVISTLGGGGPGGGTAASGSLFVALKDASWGRANAQAIITRLRAPFAQMTGITPFLMAVQDVRMGGRGTHSQYQYAVHAQDVGQLRHWAPKLMAALSALPELRDVATDQPMGGLQVRVALDRERGARAGVTPAAIDDALYTGLGQRQVATVFDPSNAYRVVLEACPQDRGTPRALEALYVRGDAGEPLALAGLTQQALEPVALSVNHEGAFAATTLSFNLAPQVALSQAVRAIDRAQAALGLPDTVSTAFAGTAKAYAASSAQQPLLVLAALAVVYVVLGVLYESAWHPLTILSTLPSAGVGALLALWATGTALNLLAFVGMILLIGIVKKNAIMMVDVALVQEREHQAAPADAIVHACVVRFRPIMMTTAAALLGALPLALGGGMGSELRRPLGIAIVGGLLVSQCLTLWTTPAIYLLLDRLRRFCARRAAA